MQVLDGAGVSGCRKCAGDGTRGHHWECMKRGGGHRGRRWAVWRAARLAELAGVRLRVRRGRSRGRSGVGLSLPAAFRRSEVVRSSMAGTKADIEERAKLAGLGAGVNVTSDAPGHVVVTPSGRRPWWLLEQAQRELEMHAPVGSRLVVAGVS